MLPLAWLKLHLNGSHWYWGWKSTTNLYNARPMQEDAYLGALYLRKKESRVVVDHKMSCNKYRLQIDRPKKGCETRSSAKKWWDTGRKFSTWHVMASALKTYICIKRSQRKRKPLFITEKVKQYQLAGSVFLSRLVIRLESSLVSLLIPIYIFRSRQLSIAAIIAFPRYLAL